MKKLNIEKIKYFIYSIFVAFGAYGVFLYPHYSQDTYAKSLYDYAWSFKAGISSGRYTYWLIKYIIYSLFKTEALNNVFTNALCIIFFAGSIFYTFTILVYNDKKKNVVFLLSAAIFVNPCFVDYFQFPECNIVYSFGLILAIASAKSLFNSKYGRIRQCMQSAFILIITVGIYQPIINYFLLIGLLIVWKEYANIIGTNKKKATLNLVQNVTKCLILYLTSSILQLVITSLGGTSNRVNKDYIQNIKKVIRTQASLWTMQSTGNKTYIYMILFCFAALLLMIQLHKYYYEDFLLVFVTLFILYVGIYISTFATHIMAEPWLSQRTTSVFYSHIVLILYALFTVADINYDNAIIGIASILICLFLYRSNNLAVQNIKTNAYDEQIVYFVDQFIESYENEKQVSIKNIAVAHDNYVTWSYPGIVARYDLNVRAWCYNWAISGLIYQYTGEVYNIIPMEDERKETVFGNKDWTTFSYDQLFAEGDTLYMMIY